MDIIEYDAQSAEDAGDLVIGTPPETFYAKTPSRYNANKTLEDGGDIGWGIVRCGDTFYVLDQYEFQHYDWLEDLYGHIQALRVDHAIDLLLDRVDDLCLKGAFSRVESVVQAIDLTRLCPTTICCLASALYPARLEIDYPSIHERMRVVLTSMVGPVRCAAIFQGFEPRE